MQPLGLQVVVDWPTTTALIFVSGEIEHAGDGLHYSPKTPGAPLIGGEPTIVAPITLTFTGSEDWNAPPSHGDVRIAVGITAAATTTCRVEVHATGRSRVTRAAHDRAAGDEVLTDSLRERLPRGVADQIESFRRRAAMSPETLVELEHHWGKSDAEGGPIRRAEEVSHFLSGRAKREVERFQRELSRLPPHVMHHLKRGIAKQAHAELMRPAWGEGVDEGRDDE